MKLRQWEISLLIIPILALGGCSQKMAQPTNKARRQALSGKVLIATQKTEFKRTVVSEIKDDLSDNVFYVRVVDLKWLPNETAADFNAIVILNRCMAGRPDPRVESFIDTFPDKEKIIVLTTGEQNSWQPDSAEIDAISSASTMSQTSSLAKSIADKVMIILDSQNQTK